MKEMAISQIKMHSEAEMLDKDASDLTLTGKVLIKKQRETIFTYQADNIQ